MLLPKVKDSRPFRLFKVYAAWLIFISAVFIATNAFSSLDKVAAYKFNYFDVAMTYGFMMFLGVLEAAAAAVGLILVELLLEKLFDRNLETPFRILLALGLAASWVLLFLSIFHRI